MNEQENFTDALRHLIKGQNLMKCTHLNLSGIEALNHSNFMDLMNELFDYSNCENLLSIHLDDLGINVNQKTKDDIMDVFRVPTKY